MNNHASRPDRAGSALAPPRSEAAGAGRVPHAFGLRVSLALVVAGVLAQIAYPLLSGAVLRAATVLSVLLLAAASLVHAGAVHGRRGALLVLLVAGGLGLAAETIGVHTGFPFGAYRYADTLGPRLAGVPLVVPLAWTMLAYPCLLLGRRLALNLRDQAPVDAPAAEPRPGGHDRWRSSVTAALGGLGLAGWDLFLDPQMVAQGHWSWAHPAPALPGVPGVPLTNYAGWLLVSVLMIAVLDRVLPRDPARDHQDRDHQGKDQGRAELVPAAVLAWTWCGSAVGNVVFFDRPWVALYGGLVMGVVVLPYLLLVRTAAASNTGSRT
jgi:uncharacterized membrane protein